MNTPGSLFPTSRGGDISSRISNAHLDAASKKEAATKTAMEKELNQLRLKMDSRMEGLQSLENLVERNKPASHMLESVMAEVEQKNSELVSLYRSSEKNRLDMVAILKEQNHELKILRANAVTMRTVESDVNALTERKNVLEVQIKDRDQELHVVRKQEHSLRQRYRELDRQGEHTTNEYNTKADDISSKIVWANERLAEKDSVIDRTELTVKELFEKCQQLGTSNSDTKKELENCVETGNRFMDINTKLQYCKNYLEEQLEILLNELKSARVENEQLKLEFSELNAEKLSCARNIVLINEELSQSSSEVKLFKETLKSMQSDLKDYESGELRSTAVINEINKEKRGYELAKSSLEKKMMDLESKRDVLVEELKTITVQEKKQNIRLMELDSKISFYQTNFVEKQELLKMKGDLEAKYKLDMNVQVRKVNAFYDKQSEELSRAMKASLALREEVDSGLSGPAPDEYLYSV